MKIPAAITVVIMGLFFLPLNAFAYLGPGLGAGTIGAIVGVIVSIFLGIFAVVYYPIKRMLKKSGLIKKERKSDADSGVAGQNEQEGGRE